MDYDPWLGAQDGKIGKPVRFSVETESRIWQLSPVIQLVLDSEPAAGEPRGALGTAQARTRVLAASRFHHSARRLAVICVLTSAALTRSLQPTATRCAFSFFMTKTVSEIISLVPGSRG